MPSVSELSVHLSADTKDLDRGLSDASKNVEGFGSKLSGIGSTMATVFGGAALAGVGALAAGFAVGLDGATELENATNKLQGQLGLTSEEAAAMGDVVKNVFRNNFGESQEAVGEAVATISQNIKGLTPAATQAATESALALESLFEAPVAESSRAVGVMMKNFQGLSESQAFDLLAVGFQKGGNFADDLLDTMTEYAPQFAKMGLNAEQAMGTLIAGADAGAFNMDKVGDAVKEFNIRAIDGSKTTAEGFAAIGLDADKMSAAIAKGGPAAEQAYGATLTALSGMEDPLKRNLAGVQLFGTQWEDIGPTVVESMAKGLRGVEGFEGAAKRAADGTSQGFAPAVEGLKRAFTGLLTDAVMPLLPGMTSVVTAISKGLPDAVEMAKAALAPFTAAFKQAMGGDITGAVETLKEGLRQIGSSIVAGVEKWATTFAGWVDSAGPDLLANLGDMAIELLDWVQDAGADIVEKLATWAAAFIDWIGPKIPDMLREAGAFLVKLTDWIVNDAGPKMVTNLLKWGAAFVDWIGPKIQPMLLEAGKLLFELGEWIITKALPAIVLKLAEWGGAFLKWVAKDVLPTLPTTLAEIGTAVGKWIGTEVATIGNSLVAWGGAFLAWVAKDVIPTLPEKLGAIITSISTWVSEKTQAVATSVKDIGSGIVSGIQNGISGSLDGFWNWLQRNFVDQIPDFVRKLLNIHSPSGVFMDIGRNVVEGLRVGMEGRLPSIDDVVSRLVGRIATAGEVSDWLQAAMGITGVGGDWLTGLQRLTHLESTGNPHAVNPVEVMGQHASGLLQMLPSTFRAYKVGGLPGDIFDPIANAAASIRYISDTYGHVNNIPGLFGDFRGYAEGGWAGLHGPELAWLGEKGPEYVVPNHDLRRGGGGSMQTVRVDVALGGRIAEEIYVTGREMAIKRRRVPVGSN